MTGSDADKDGQGDLAVLYPELPDTVAGVPVVMREYTFVEGMQHGVQIAAVTAAFRKVMSESGAPSLEQMDAAFAVCVDEVMHLVALACDQPEKWVRSLNDEDGRQLRAMWWAVNAHFFARRVTESVVWALEMQRHSVGATSSPPSTPPATPHTTSADTRTVN